MGLRASLDSSRLAIDHSAELGSATEENWIGLLRTHLPQRYQADKAFVIDSLGATSEQIDIVIHDRQYSPLIYTQSKQVYVPAESVYAVLEVKQQLDRGNMVYAGEKAASVRRLHRTSVPVHHLGGVSEPPPLSPVLAGVVALESSWSPPFGGPFHETLKGLPAEQRLDLGCALKHGAFEAVYPETGSARVELAHEVGFLASFFFCLLKRLQACRTVPAIDYDAYLNGARRQAAQSDQATDNQ